MKNLTNCWGRPAEMKAMIPQFSRMHLTRSFVETGDERCPIAGVWSRLENDAAADDSELLRPAMRRLLLWRALPTALSLQLRKSFRLPCIFASPQN